MKQCTRCSVVKPRAEFYRRSAAKDGLYMWCKSCTKATVNAHTAANRDVVRERNRVAGQKFRDANRDRERARISAYYRANPEKALARSEAWRKANPEIHCARQSRRRADKFQATPKWANQKYIQLFYRMAKEESERIGRKVHVDHMVPLKHPLVCGLHCEFNLQLLLGSENIAKGNRTWPGM